jgi:hypothetical protein
MQLTNRAKQIAVGATILRCGCDPPPVPPHKGIDCPNQIQIPYGAVHYRHYNPLFNLLWWVSRKLGYRGYFWISNKDARKGNEEDVSDNDS